MKAEIKGTICRALQLLDHFDSRQRELSLGQLAALSGHDKAKTRRYLLALMNSGLAEQCPISRQYRIGVAVHRLAYIRDAGFSLRESVETILRSLTAVTRETTHCSQLCGLQLGNIGVVESEYSHRISITPGMLLPLHATSSGTALMAFGGADLTEAVLNRELRQYTEATVISRQKLLENLDEARRDGYSQSCDTYELGANSIAMPTFNEVGIAVGAVSIAAPSTRMNNGLALSYVPDLQQAAQAITAAQKGHYPENYPQFQRAEAA